MTDHLPFSLSSREETPPLSSVLGTLLRVWILEYTAGMYPLNLSLFLLNARFMPLRITTRPFH
jgi:hypothetical protein